MIRYGVIVMSAARPANTVSMLPHRLAQPGSTNQTIDWMNAQGEKTWQILFWLPARRAVSAP